MIFQNDIGVFLIFICIVAKILDCYGGIFNPLLDLVDCKQVRVVSPDKDFFQILSPSLRLLRIASRGIEYEHMNYFLIH